MIIVICTFVVDVFSILFPLSNFHVILRGFLSVYTLYSFSLSKLILWVKIQTCLSDRLWKPLNPKSNDDCPNLGQYFKCSGLLKCHSFSFLLDSIQHHGKHITHDMAHCLSPWVKQTHANKP